MAERHRREQFEAPEPRISDETQDKIIRWLQIGTMVAILLFIIFPLYWTVTSAFRPTEVIFAQGYETITSLDFTVSNIFELFTETGFRHFLYNSLIVAGGATLLTGTLAVLGGYGLARAQFRGKRNLARIVLFTYMFPSMLIGIPLYAIFFQAGLLNSKPALILAHSSRSLPFTLWLMWQFFQTIPRAYEESAWIYGASTFKAFRQIVAPMAIPGVIATAIFAFALSWNDYTLAVILMTDSNSFTIPVGIEAFQAREIVHWGYLNAASFVAMVPAFLLVLFMQKYILTGISIGR
jgi:multiple sugar transport system permease protein